MATREVDDKLAKYRDIQIDIKQLFNQKQQALSQFNENTLVKGELDLLNPDEQVYKLVGPVLMNVELNDAKENVSKRLEFIGAEVEKFERATNEKLEAQKKIGDEIAEIQQKMQAEAAAAAKAIAPVS